MGDNYGPVVVVRADGPHTLDNVSVAVPGLLTTAFLSLKMYAPAVQVTVMPFDEIQPAVRDGKEVRRRASMIIHEGQLTYESEGLRKIVDLGEWWATRPAAFLCLSVAM